jgi:amino acid adenylation domain-containing protein/non-ribosomal peptide synthase protein (TIGR01720 family)
MQVNTFELTQPQQRVWNIEKIYPGTPIHNIGGVSVFDKGILLDRLEMAFLFSIKQNNSFQIRICQDGDTPMQYMVSDEGKIELDVVDFSLYPDSYTRFQQWAKQEFSKPFNLTDSPLYYIALIKIDQQQTAFLLKVHHIIIDGWSVSLFLNQVYERYRVITGDQFENGVTRFDYFDFVKDEVKYMQSDAFNKDKIFWKERFEDFSPSIYKGNTRSLAGKRQDFVLPSELSERIIRYTKEGNFSLNIFFVAIVLLVEQRNSGNNDLTIGLPLLNRANKNHKQVIGMYTSSMPFRVRLAENLTLKHLLAFIKSELKDCYKHQQYPYNFIIRDSELRKRNIDKLFSVCVNYYSTKLPVTLLDAAIRNLEFHNGYQFYDLQVTIKEWLNNNALQLQFDYNTDLYSDFEVNALYETIIYLAQLVCDDDTKLLSDIDMLSSAEKNNITLFFNKPVNPEIRYCSIVDMWRNVNAQLEGTFIIDQQGIAITYQEFYAKVQQVAMHFRKLSIKKQDRVCVIMTHSSEYIVSVMSLLTQGIVFIPIDSNTPLDRIKYIIEDTGAKLLITNILLFTNYEHLFNVSIFYYKNIEASDPAIEFVFEPVFTEDLAYIIYTSGSTGKPKGVPVTHGNFVNYCSWAVETYIKSDNDVFAFFSSIGFDLTITSVFIPLISKGKIEVFSSANDDPEHVLFKVFKSEKVNIVKLTPSHLSLLISDYSVIGIREKPVTLIVGGEDFKTSLAESVFSIFNGNAEIYNEYGPTEATVGCMIYKFDSGSLLERSVPIGKPIYNTSIYILDNQLRNMPMGGIGEIFIGGSSVSPGYWNNEDLNREKFIKGAVHSEELLYRTGDLGRFIDGYNIAYEGRRDEQIKINGNRIELKEIESVLNAYPLVTDSFVTVITDDSGNGGQVSGKKYIAAFLIVGNLYLESILVDFLNNKLPSYMIPAYLIPIDKFPLNTNGKVDKKQLPFPVKQVLAVDKADTLALSATEALVVDSLKLLLNIDEINLDDNFFAIGGDSITAIQLSSKLSNSNYYLSVQSILANPTISNMVQKISCRSSEPALVNEALIEDHYFSTPIVNWFFEQHFMYPGYYHQSVLIELKVDLSTVIIREIIQTLVRHHDSLRINVDLNLKQLRYNFALLSKKIQIQEYVLDDTTTPEEQLVSIGNDLKSGIEFNDDYLFRIAVINGSNNQRWLLLVFHHLIIDGVSLQIILNDFKLLISSVLRGLPLRIVTGSIPWFEWAGYLLEEHQSPVTKKELAVLAEIGSRDFNNHILKILDPLPLNGHTIFNDYIGLPDEEVLQSVMGLYRITIAELINIVFLLSWSKVADQKNILFEIEKHGREQLNSSYPDVSHTVGWFTVFDLRYVGISSGTIKEQVIEVKDQIRTPLFEPYRYSFLKDLHKVVPDSAGLVRFNYLGSFNDVDNDYFKISGLNAGNDIHPLNTASSLLEFNCWITDKKLNFRINYNNSFINKSLCESFCDGLRAFFASVFETATDSKTVVYTSYSDFKTARLSNIEFDALFD